MTITREKRFILMENEGSDKYESDESTAVTARRRRSGLNYLSWVTDHNSEGKTTMDIIVDWLKIKENYTKVMEDLAFDNKAAAMRNYDGIVKKLIETEHVSRKPEAVRQHCIELQNKFYSVLDEFDGLGYAFTEKKDNEVRVLDKNKRKKRLSELVKKKCKYFYDLRPVNLEWEAASPDASNYYVERRKIRSENQIVNGHSSRASSNKRLREDANANNDDEKSVVTQKDDTASKVPRVIAETDDEDDDELSSAQSSRANSPYSSAPGLKKYFSNGSINSENTQSSSSNTSSTVINRVELKDGLDEENSRYPQSNKNTTQHPVTTTSRKVDSQENHIDIEKHKQSKNRSTENTRQRSHSERRHNTSNMEQNTHNDAPHTKRRKKKKGGNVNSSLKLATRRLALEERKVTLAEREMALEEKRLALQERVIEDQMSKKRFSLLNWLF